MATALHAQVEADPASALGRMAGQLQQAGLTDEEIEVVSAALARNPGAVARYAAAFELGRGEHAGESPLVHASWMFIADICAAAIPVLPFAFLAIDPARAVSLVLTCLLLFGLGVTRGRIAHKSLLLTAAQTLAIAGAAALAGIAMGKFVTG